MSQINIDQVDLNLLKTFEALHDESSASRAALRLGVTQSAISAGLRRLREVYGDQLFVRTGRGLAPTLRANQLKPVISEALDRCRQSLAMVNPDNQQYQGRSVVLGLSDDFEIAYGRRLIDAIAQRAPKLRVIFRQTHSQIVAGALLDRTLDLAITAGGFAQGRLSRQVLGKVIIAAWWIRTRHTSAWTSSSRASTFWCRQAGLSASPMKAWRRRA